jgi:hypothetical protein
VVSIQRQLAAAAMSNRSFPSGIPATSENLELFSRLSREIAEMPDGIVPELPWDFNDEVEVFPPQSVNQPEVVKVGPEGYIHGFICVAPPCGDRPKTIEPYDLKIQRDGGIVHRLSGYSVGHLAKNDDGTYTATHADGMKDQPTKGQFDSLRAVSRRYNSGQTDAALSSGKPSQAVAAKPVAKPAVKPEPAAKPVSKPPAKPVKPSSENLIPGSFEAGQKLWSTDVGELPSALSENDKKALKKVYFSSAFNTTNSQLRAGNLDKSRIGGINLLTDLIKKSNPTTEPVIVHRGIKQADKILGPVGFQIGRKFTDKGIVSTTTVPGIAKLYTGSDSAHIFIHVPAGTHMFKSIDVVPESDGEAEKKSRNAFHEFVLPPGTSFHIDSDSRNAEGQREVHMTVMPSL